MPTELSKVRLMELCQCSWSSPDPPDYTLYNLIHTLILSKNLLRSNTNHFTVVCVLLTSLLA
jgi:hypothetical protein